MQEEKSQEAETQNEVDPASGITDGTEQTGVSEETETDVVDTDDVADDGQSEESIEDDAVVGPEDNLPSDDSPGTEEESLAD